MSQMESEAFSRAFLQNPTREYLQENYTKPQLQKQCQLLGLRSIWVRKDDLVDMIIDHFSEQMSRTLNNQQNSQQGDATNNATEVDITAIYRKFEQFERRLEAKDSEIAELKNRLIKAEDQIKNMNTILRTLQEENLNDQQCQTAKKTLLIGDSTLYKVRISDLDEACEIRTIPEANFSLVNSWINLRIR